LQVFPTERVNEPQKEPKRIPKQELKVKEINEWKRPLAFDEYKVLFYVFFFLSFVVDFVTAHAKRLWKRGKDKIPLRSGLLPQS
jgi:hypothetical protein